MSAHPPPGLPARRLVMAAAEEFLRSQERVLAAALRDAPQPQVAERLWAAQPAALQAWASTLSAVGGQAPADVLDRVVELQGFHARVVRGIATEESMRSDGPMETAVRRLLADQLEQMTERCVADLRGLAEA